MRRTKDVEITAAGRDKQKVFVLTEMPAAQAEKWAVRLLLLAAAGGADVGNAMSGMAGVAVLAFESAMRGLRFAELEPLLDEMMTCVKVRPEPRNPAHQSVVRELVPEDIEEVATLITLRAEVLSLHVGFSIADALSAWRAEAEAAARKDSQTTGTSPGP